MGEFYKNNSGAGWGVSQNSAVFGGFSGEFKRGRTSGGVLNFETQNYAPWNEGSWGRFPENGSRAFLLHCLSL